MKGIEIGTTYIFPKIDGRNSSVWLDSDRIRAGSRNKELTSDTDNADFYTSISKDINILSYLKEYPTHRLFGEWLVPHNLRTYKKDAWYKFYIFDVCIDTNPELEYIPYSIYQPLLDKYKLNYIQPIAVIKNGNYEDFVRFLKENTFLIEEDKGFGEGIVIKNYDFYNKYQKQIWAKIVASEFKEKSSKTFVSSVDESKLIEEHITDEFVTSAFIEKEYAKIVNDKKGWSSKYIPLLLGKVFYELIHEETWNIIKKYKNPCINFKTLYVLTIDKIRTVKPEIFR